MGRKKKTNPDLGVSSLDAAENRNVLRWTFASVADWRKKKPHSYKTEDAFHEIFFFIDSPQWLELRCRCERQTWCNPCSQPSISSGLWPLSCTFGDIKPASVSRVLPVTPVTRREEKVKSWEMFLFNDNKKKRNVSKRMWKRSIIKSLTAVRSRAIYSNAFTASVNIKGPILCRVHFTSVL